MSSTAQVSIDEVDVTSFSVEGSSTRALNRPATAQVRLPMQHAVGGPGSLLKVYFDGVLHHHGRVLLCETTADKDMGYTVYNSTDPFELWNHRPVRDPGGVEHFMSSCGKVQPVNDPGDFSFPSLVQDFQTGPEIVEAMMFASQNEAVGADDAEGPLFLLTDGTSFACGGTNLSGTPTNWPMTMAQLATLLVSTGELDLVITPIELDIDGNYGRLDAYNGRYGDDLTSSVAFQYGMGQFNIQSLRWNQDMTNLCNKLWYYLGPKQEEPQRWKANIVGTAGGIHNPTFWSECGLDSSDAARWNAWHAGVVACAGTDFGDSGDSRGDFGVRMDVRVFDALGIEATLGFCLYKKQWLMEQWLRCRPRDLVHITPTRDTDILAFDIGDLVLVEAVAAVKGGFSGAQRVYEYTIGWEGAESVCALSELQTSPDNEGFDQ